VRPGTGREAGLGHAGSDPSKLPACLIIGLFRKICGYLSNGYYSRKGAKHAKKLLIFLNKLIDSTSNAILHEGFTEIQQITQPHPCETEVAEQLLLVCIVEFLNTLGLYNNLVLNNEIGAKAFIKPDSLVLNGDGNLSFNLKTALP